MVTQAILNPQAQLAFHVAKSNITDVYFCFDHEFSALSGTVDAAGAGATTVAPWYPVASGADPHQIAISDNRADAQKNNFNPLMQTEGRRHLKRVNFLPWPEYLTSCGLGSTDAIAAQATKSLQWRLMLGSKPIPENFVSGSREALGLLKESLGIASSRDGTSCGGLTYDLTKHISGVNFEKAVGGLRGQGISTRRPLLRVTGSVKSVILPTPEEATPLGEAPCCGKLLKLDSTTPLPKGIGGTRVMTGSKGKNLSRYMDNPQGYCLQCVMEAYGRLSETERVSLRCDGRPIRSEVKIQSNRT